MDRNARRGWIQAGVVWVAAPALQGCGVKTASLNELGLGRVEVLPAEENSESLKHGDLYGENGERVAKGTARKDSPIFITYEGHIDGALLDAPGQTIGVKTVKYRPIPARRHYSAFQVRFPAVTERGTLARLLFHLLDPAEREHLAAVAWLTGTTPDHRQALGQRLMIGG